MKHSDRVRFLELCYDYIRRDLLPEAPATATIVFGFTAKKKAGQLACMSECHHEVMAASGEAFGGENVLTVNFLEEDPVLLLSHLLVAMIRHGLEPAAKNGKAFQTIAKRVGLCRPWARPEPDGTLQHTLRGLYLEVAGELGYELTGHFVPKPPTPRKPSSATKIRCHCDSPRMLTLTAQQLEKGPLFCGVCQRPFRVMTAGGDAVGGDEAQDVPEMR